MKPAFAHLSPTVSAAFAAAIGASLSIFLLPGAGVQGEPMPLLPAIGGVVGRVAADLPVTASKRTSKPAGPAAPSAQLVATPTVQVVPQRREAASRTHRAQRPARARVVRHAPSPPARVPVPVAPATPVATTRSLGTPTRVRGKARGHDRARAPKSTAGALPSRAHGHGKALGRSGEHHHGLPPGQAKKAPAAAPVAPPKAHGGGPPADTGGGKGGKR